MEISCHGSFNFWVKFKIFFNHFIKIVRDYFGHLLKVVVKIEFLKKKSGLFPPKFVFKI